MPSDKILIIDDDSAIRILVRNCLREYEVLEASDGEAGLEKALQASPDLLIVDWTMPKMDGDEVCRVVRETPAISDVPILMLTARGEVADQVRGLSSGADDYIVKPFDPAVLRARVQSLLKRRARTEYLDPLMRVLGDLWSKRGIEQLGRELEVAHEIQMGMLPQTRPRLPRMEVGAALVPCSVVGGDFYDFFTLGDGQVCVAIGDVSGKGVPAALLMVMVRIMLRLLARENRPPDDLIRAVNDVLVVETAPDWFATLCCIFLQPGSSTVTYCNAGHCPIMVYDPARHSYRLLESNGPGLGIFSDQRFRIDAYSVSPGSILVALTDGVLDAVLVDDIRVRYEQVAEIVRDHADQDADGLARTLIDEAVPGEGKHRDDLAVVVIKAE
ncbi:MAG: PP2C family protein-serine/threonine phosphatase [Armatimonadota bacterium]